MIRRPLLVAAAFAASALLLLGALAWITSLTLALERSEVEAVQRFTNEENIRIALWRLDASLAELLARENRRPATGFRASVERGAPSTSAEVDASRLVHTRFEVGADRKLRAEPRVSEPEWLADLAIPSPPPRARRRSAPEPEVPTTPDPWLILKQAPGQLVDNINVAGNDAGQQSVYTVETLNTQAFQRRQELGQQTAKVIAEPDPSAGPAEGVVTAPPGEGTSPRLDRASAPASAVVPESLEAESPFEPTWKGSDLLLLRRVRRGPSHLLQGTWLDWDALRSWLLAQVDEVVPGAGLEPWTGAPDPGRQLALLPVRLVPGPTREVAPPDWTPVRLTLAAAWGAALLCLAGVGALLAGSVALSQRRADFVSAVTHELRTPLTTLRLYSDLLVEGAVAPEEHGSYLATLKREADRLGHLVDNVLSFSRLERVRSPGLRSSGAREQATVGEVIERALARLEERAALAGLELEVEVPAAVAGERVRLDLASVEQILFNLVDNACKYGACKSGGNAERPALRLAAELRGRHAVLSVSDHGPGIGPRERRRLFRPFHRSVAQAAGSAPGVGLGLALSRRLARRMGGDLRLARSEQGASFELWLRRT